MNRRLIQTLAVIALLALVIVPVAHAEESQPTFTVVGLVYEDQNFDGAYGLTLAGVEPGVSSVTVGLYLDNAPFGVLGTEDKLLEAQVTNGEGYVVFRNVVQGTFLLRTTPVTRFVSTTPNTQVVKLAGIARGAALEWTFGLAPRSEMPARVFLPSINR